MPMTDTVTLTRIAAYVAAQPDAKRGDMEALHALILDLTPGRLWFLDGKNEDGKVVTNPNIGYGQYTIAYADGSRRDFYQVGLSANTSGISVYIMGLKDKSYLSDTYKATLDKATITGYCIRFKKLSDIDVDVLRTVVRDRLAMAEG